MLIFLLLTLAASDLPVHCTYDQVLGDWEFYEESEQFEASLSNTRTFCGHGQPGKVQDLSPSEAFSFPSPIISSVTFSEPNLATSSLYGSGIWTLIYDEGFILSFPSITYTTYFFYYKDDGDYKSKCDSTTIGWYRGEDPKNHSNWGCFYAQKSQSVDETSEKKQDSVNWVQPEYTSFLETSMIYDDYQSQVDNINSAQNLWTAELNPEFKGKSFLQISKDLGLRTKVVQGGSKKSRKGKEKRMIVEDPNWERLVLVDSESLRYFWDYDISEVPAEYLPKEWDWSDIDGVSYISPAVREQLRCGSCYAITTVEMLESRLRILTNNQFDKFLSAQYLVSCSFYTEGCAGGYPTLLNKFIQEFDIITEECMAYKGTEIECEFDCIEGDRVSVESYNYIGEFYGNSDEENLMLELRLRGPLIVNLNPSQDFFYYKGGIYSKVSEELDIYVFSDDSIRELGIPWEKVTHSVLLVGYGEEKGIKYWKCLNSWGTNWGEDGYFRIKRGSNEYAIESMGEYAVPVIVRYS